jgi:hypothetical protein
VISLPEQADPANNSLAAWKQRYLDMAVRVVHSADSPARPRAALLPYRDEGRDLDVREDPT